MDTTYISEDFSTHAMHSCNGERQYQQTEKEGPQKVKPGVLPHNDKPAQFWDGHNRKAHIMWSAQRSPRSYCVAMLCLQVPGNIDYQMAGQIQSMETMRVVFAYVQMFEVQ